MADSEYTQKDMKAFNKSANADQKEIASLRKDAVGLLTSKLLTDHITSEQKLVLAYGRRGETREYELKDLKAFVDAQKRKIDKFNNNAQGVPLMLLERSSRPIDISRARDVRNATLYEIKGNVLSFRVTGKEQPHYRVQIRLEEWDAALTSIKPLFLAAREVAVGRLSIECPCGRHQYWYRYLATIGNFAIEPKELDFPKIRNKTLYGCCCKHVLRALSVLKTNTLHLTLAKELERQRATRKGFAPKATAKNLTGADMRTLDNAAKARAPREARMAMDRFRREAAEAAMNRQDAKEKQKTLTARPVPKLKSLKNDLAKAKISKSLRNEVIFAAQVAIDTKISRQGMIDSIANRKNISREHIEAILKEENL